MAFVVSHMHRGIKAAKPSLLLLLCHSVAVHTVIPAAGSRQLLFFLCFIFFFFPSCFSSPYKWGEEGECLGETWLCPFPFYHIGQAERESSQSKGERIYPVWPLNHPFHQHKYVHVNAKARWFCQTRHSKQMYLLVYGLTGTCLCSCSALQGYLPLKEYSCTISQVWAHTLCLARRKN